jgi:hypothetical protein
VRVHANRPVGGIRREMRARSARGYKAAATSVVAERRERLRFLALSRIGRPAVLAVRSAAPRSDVRYSVHDGI